MQRGAQDVTHRHSVHRRVNVVRGVANRYGQPTFRLRVTVGSAIVGPRLPGLGPSDSRPEPTPTRAGAGQIVRWCSPVVVEWCRGGVVRLTSLSEDVPNTDFGSLNGMGHGQLAGLCVCDSPACPSCRTGTLVSRSQPLQVQHLPFSRCFLVFARAAFEVEPPINRFHFGRVSL